MIRRIGVLCLLVLCVFASVCSAEKEEKWEYITESNGIKYYYNSTYVGTWKPIYIAEINQTLVSVFCDIKEEDTYTKTKKAIGFAYTLVDNEIVDIKFNKKNIYLWNYNTNSWIDTKEYNEKWYPAKGVMETIALHLYHKYY